MVEGKEDGMQVSQPKMFLLEMEVAGIFMKKTERERTLLLAELEGLSAVGQEGGARVGDNLSRK